MTRLLATDDPGMRLMLRLRRGDAGAFGELASLFGPSIRARFIRVFRDRHEAEDLTQEVFLRLYRSRKTYRPRARFTTWLFHITQNVARNALRSRRRRIRLHLGFDSSPDGAVEPAREEKPWLPLERREIFGVVRGAVGALCGNQRRALEMRQFQHRSYRQIAAALDLSPKATKSLLYRARLQLRSALQGQAEALL